MHGCETKIGRDERERAKEREVESGTLRERDKETRRLSLS